MSLITRNDTRVSRQLRAWLSCWIRHLLDTTVQYSYGRTDNLSRITLTIPDLDMNASPHHFWKWQLKESESISKYDHYGSTWNKLSQRKFVNTWHERAVDSDYDGFKDWYYVMLEGEGERNQRERRKWCLSKMYTAQKDRHMYRFIIDMYIGENQMIHVTNWFITQNSFCYFEKSESFSMTESTYNLVFSIIFRAAWQTGLYPFRVTILSCW